LPYDVSNEAPGPKALETMATSEPAKFCQMVAGLLPKEMHIQDAPLTIREVRHVIVEAIKAGDKAIEQRGASSSTLRASRRGVPRRQESDPHPTGS